MTGRTGGPPIDATAELREPRVALVTGAAGFAGRHLVDTLLRDTAWTVVGISRRRVTSTRPDRYRTVVADLLDPWCLRTVVAAAAPDYVFHLAGAMPPAPATEILSVNVGGATSLLEAVATECPGAAVLVVGSDAQYGPQDISRGPTPESAPTRPVGPYGRSKVLQEGVGLEYGRMTGLRVVCARPFNHIGPGQSDRFVVGAIARQVAEAEVGPGPPEVTLGRVDAYRDFTDVRDMVRAYLQVLVAGQSGGVYNIGTGTTLSIREIVTSLTSAAAIPVSWQSVPDPNRSSDVPATICDASKLTLDTGWMPTIPIETTLADVLSFWRETLQKGRAFMSHSSERGS